ncbi:MAG TPA: hypothetical protein VK797_12525 [Tepidisphaeraceae bacterium]|nr:hypothetical protein [Tepidisphaeraceae bacterium]
MIALGRQMASAEVTIDRKPPTVERRTFDPAHRPADMPPLTAGEAAVTQSQFDCSADVDYKVTARKSDDAACSTTVRVEGMRLTLRLRIVIWLPPAPPSALVVHEEGHRQIGVQVFEKGDELAERIAGKIDGLSFTKSAADCLRAEQAAAQAAADQFCQEYLAAIGRRATRVNDAYDKITSHGTRSEPPQEEAIRQAFTSEEYDGDVGLSGQSASKR